MMNYALRYLFVLIWIAYLICSGVYLFSMGFLLSRVTSQEISTCRHLRPDEVKDEESFNKILKDNDILTENLCLPKLSKIVILVIDALKFDFGVYKTDKINPLPYENRIRIFHELLMKNDNHSRLFQFRADPPTTTLQRLKGLTTGSLPTFIDIGSNFATPEINEDNIIDQAVRNNLSIVFLGDDTWTDLYPKRFKRQYSYSSFDIYDLDTIDNKILQYLPDELNKNDWDLLIAHFLGVDHCGHRYGPLHSEMSRKLNEMDDMIRMVISKMDDNTVLFVISDHGMTYSGNHGGESDDELNALLFVYMKSHNFLTIDDFSNHDNYHRISQIDLIPTLAVILGIPIPYSNLGQINFNLIPDTMSMKSLELKLQLNLLYAWQNVRQIYKYFLKYALENQKQFNEDDLNDIKMQYEELLIRANEINMKTYENIENELKEHLTNLDHFMKNILNLCRDLWIKFDANQMSQGLLLTFLPIFFSFLLINNSHVLQFTQIFHKNLIIFIYLSNFIAAIFGWYFYSELSMRSHEHGLIFVTSLLSAIILSFLTIQNWCDIAINWYNMKRFSNMPTRFIFIISCSVFFSNSFIIEEGKILSYLIAVLIAFMLYELIQEYIHYEIKLRFKFSSFLKSIVFKLIIFGLFAIILLRCANQFFRCREEQIDCEDYSLMSFFDTISSNNDMDLNRLITNTMKETKLKINFLSIVILIVYIILIRIYLRSCGNLTGYSINVLLGRYGPIIGAISCAGHLLLSNSNLRNINMSHIDRMAWIVYILFGIQCLVIFIYPTMTYVIQNSLPSSFSTISINSTTNIVPELFKKIKQTYNQGGNTNQASKQESIKPEIPIVFGLSTIYSSVLISFGVFLLLFLVILLDGRPSLGLFICLTIAIIILTIHSILRYRTAYKLETCKQPTFTVIVCWLLLSHFSFFATSHQTTLSQIEWKAAFIGRSANYDHSIILSGILVLANTFSGQILFMILNSLLISETFSIYALFPRLIRHNPLSTTATLSSKEKRPNFYNNEVRLVTISKNEMQYQSIEFDITRGELILYENDKIYIGSVFKLGCQFFMLQGLRIFCAMMACTIHCRHLMVWKIFAPRFIYEGIATFISFPVIIIGYLIVIRLHWSVNKLINQVNKTK